MWTGSGLGWRSGSPAGSRRGGAWPSRQKKRAPRLPSTPFLFGLGDGSRPVFPPQSVPGLPGLTVSCIAARRPPLVRSACLPEAPLRPARHWFRAPAPRFHPASRFLDAGHLPMSPPVDASLRLRPRFRVSPGLPRAGARRSGPTHRSPEVRVPIDATQPCRATAPGGFHSPGHVASSRFQPASTPCSLQCGLPGLFHPGASSGFSLQGLTRRGSRRLSTAHPLLRLACSRRVAGPRRPPPLQGLAPLAGWDADTRISPFVASWPSWASSSLGLSPSSVSGLPFDLRRPIASKRPVRRPRQSRGPPRSSASCRFPGYLAGVGRTGPPLRHLGRSFPIGT